MLRGLAMTGHQQLASKSPCDEGVPMSNDPDVNSMADVEHVFDVLRLTTREQRNAYRWDVFSPVEEDDPNLLVMTRLSNSSRGFPTQD